MVGESENKPTRGALVRNMLHEVVIATDWALRFSVLYKGAVVKKCLTILGCSLLLVSGCVTHQVDDNGEVITDGEANPNDVLPLTADGLLMGTAIRIIDPTTIVINKKNPKTIHFVGVETPDPSTHPDIYERAKLYLSEHIGKGQWLLIRMQEGTNGHRKDIHGTVMMRDASDEGYLDVTQSMLSEGLLKLGDVREFQKTEVINAMKRCEQKARVARRGLWKATS